MELFRYTFRAMASENELTLGARDEATARRAADAAIGDVRRIEAKYSRYRDDTITTRINRGAGKSAVSIDPETAALLAYADQCHKLSEGRFDITSGVLRRAWDFKRRPPVLPDPQELSALVELVDWSKVEWNSTSIRLPKEGMEIDFGGVGKEYAADRVATICFENGVAHGHANLGGDVRILGPRPDGTPWRIGIRDPRAPADRPDAAVATVDVSSGAVATSGDYERYFDLDGRRYCHILNPRTGYPVSAWRSVSVVAPLCVVAGSCSTIAMLLEDRGEAFLEAQGLPYFAIAADGARKGSAAT